MSFDIEEIYLLSTVQNEDEPEYSPTFSSIDGNSRSGNSETATAMDNRGEQTGRTESAEKLFGKMQHDEQLAVQLKNSILSECKRMIDDILARQKER
ncbi:hypothetical protein [Spartinivicinus ruber]|uniref:hypothetical protein n=1 Tax=Spartinivicinus ruber TaxID=2683272 RepID=UPI0013D40382|nr:hypothetical protein [Spartinivicinus ruber]